MTVLNPFSLPLEGVRLIEASAGTGKTWNITTLYLRLLLERKLEVERILVVTFTRAATEELRDRIRGRIQAALAILAGDEKTKKKEAELAAWLETRGAEDDVRLLETALVSMDRAAVFTIHGFCQRVLTDNAFDTGMDFDPQFLEDEDELQLTAAEDFWRRFFAREALPTPVAARLLEEHGSPGELLRWVAVRLAEEPRLLPEVPSLDELLARWRRRMEAFQSAHEKLKEAWQAGKDEVTAVLCHSDALNRNTYNRAAVKKALEAAEKICSAAEPPAAPLEKQELLTAGALRRKTKRGRQTPRHPFFDRAELWQSEQEEVAAILDALVVAFRREARLFLRERLRRMKERDRQLHYDDLLTRLRGALSGPGGETLARTLRRQYPFALIDEFQDTDRIQYAIFRAIHGRGGEGVGLCLIGDPKQAIYGFRGGDIHAYLQAAREAESRHTLDTNWRSCGGLVEAVNLLFSRSPHPFLEPGIGYTKVRPAPQADEKALRIDGEVPVPLQFWKLRAREGNALEGKKGVRPIGREEAKNEAAAAVARHVQWLLQPGRATLDGRALAASDIAILVRVHQDGELVQAHLREQGVHSVALSQESVFASEEAGALLDLLRALLRCEDEALLRHALSGRLLGRDAAFLQCLLEDDGAWEEVHRRFFEYREIWRERGFIQAFQALFRREGIGPNLLALPDGERRLTNLLHLVELLQRISRPRPGMEELVRWLADEIRLAGKHEEALLRLESDEHLVKVVTVHASKGLEYPVVYLPFPWAEGSGRKGTGHKRLPWFYHDDSGNPCLYLGGGDRKLEREAEIRLDRESLAERLRLLYVSLTRAARLCVLTWGRVRNVERSALAWLLHGGGEDFRAIRELDEATLFSRLEELAAAAPEAVWVGEPPGTKAVGRPRAASAAEPMRARPFQVAIPGDWRVASYSSLVRGGGPEQAGRDAESEEAVVGDVGEDPVQALPAGARFGLVVHELLEQLDFRAADEAEIAELTQRLSWKHGVHELRTEKAREAMVTMVSRLLATKLPGAGLALGELPRERRVDEMEFHFSAAAVDPRRLARFLEDFSEWKGAADGLTFHAFQGLMHGYIDLVFRHRGRYWLVDYKSNRLEDYGPRGVEEAMTLHHYPLQALIYALALHRHLAQTLSDYDPSRHFGGIYYLFTRGMRPGGDSGIWRGTLTPTLLAALDAHFGGRAAV